MHNPADFALRRPRVVLLATVLLILLGVISYLQLPRQENPTIVDRHLAVRTSFPGAEPEKVELLVSKVLEEKISEVEDIDTILTESDYGHSFLLLELLRTAPVDERKQEIKDKVAEARALFPAGVQEPVIDAESLNTKAIVLTMSSETVHPLTLRDRAKDLKRALEALPAVRSVDMLGEPQEEIAVDVDLRALSQKGLAITQVVRALKARNVLLPGGEIDMGTVSTPIRTTGAYTSLEDVEQTYLDAGPNGLPVVLKDVANVSRRIADRKVIVRTNQAPAISLAIEMIPGKNVIELGKSVDELLQDIRPSMPKDIQFHIVGDEPTYVHERINLLTSSLLMGLVLVVFLVMVGMGWKSGLLVSLSIPLALTMAMTGLSFAGIAFHQISIAALVIAVGLVVDEAIVVTDNIQRHIDEGASPKEAAVKGLGEIHLAVMAGAMTTIAAFIPLALMKGDIGDFIRSIPISVSIMLIASVTVAHYITPLFAAYMHRFFQGRNQAMGGERHRFEPAYHRLVDFVIRHTWVVLALFGLAVYLTIARVTAMTPQMFPAADRHQFMVKVSLPPGSPVEETDGVMRNIEALLKQEPEIHDFTAFVGAGAPKFYYNEFTEGQSEQRGMFIINTQPDLPLKETPALAKRLNTELKGHIVGASVYSKELKQGYSGGSDIDLYILGDNIDVLREIGSRLVDIIKPIDGVDRVEDNFGYDPITIEANVDDARANLMGISHTDIATTLRTAVDGVTATTFRENDDEIDITVRLTAEQRRNAADLKTLPIFSPATHHAVPLSHVADLEPSWTTRTIQRWKRKRENVVTVDVQGRPAVDVANDIKTAVSAQMSLPPGYELQYEGEPQEIRESFLSLAKAAVFAIFLIYIILVVQFDSMAQPLLIMLAIPMALIGAVWGLVLTNNTLGFMAFLGFIALTGIVVNDSIVLLDYMNTLRRRGYSLEDAVSTGATRRLRPIVLTSVTTIGGLLPLSLGGGSFWAPFGFAMIFGLSASTILTLLVQPAAYLVLERRRLRTTARAVTGIPEAYPAQRAD